ncbi:MAG: glycerophosphodiester phosphodiesterase [Verrucomicrobiae bacterium]|nr:glycerophosphodiester phosphodiesterase [Verrucomicrobiae bacterium]
MKSVRITALLLMTATLSAHSAPVEIIAHRGASFDAPENTLSAVNLAWERDADAVEIDVMLSKDGRIVVIHDKDTKRLAGVERKVLDQTWEELQKLDVGKWKDSKWAGEGIPLLGPVLSTIPAGKRMFVELKTGPEIVPELKRAVKSARKQAAQIVFISFSLEACAAAKREFPEHEVAFISRYRAGKEKIETLIDQARSAGLDALDLDGNGSVGKREGEAIKRAGLKFYVWTIDDPDRAKELISAGVDGITTNRPKWLSERLR